MSIQSSARVAGPFDGNGLTTEFPFGFVVLQPTDVYVIHTDPAGVETALVKDSDYIIALNDSVPGGTVSLMAPLPTGEKLTLTSDLDYVQNLEIPNLSAFYPRTLETALDRLTILAQQNAERINRSVKVPISSSITPDSLIAQLTQDAAAAGAAAASASNSASSAVASENAAAAGALAASLSATAASNSATSASNSATTATTQASNAATSATAASNSATSASNSASAAAASENAASNSATTATTQASNAATSATAASNSATSASNSASAAAASEAAAANSAASINLPSVSGAALDMLRVKADESGYEHRTPAQVRADIGVNAATESAAGLIEIATSAEALAGTDDTRAITPAKMANVLAARTWKSVSRSSGITYQNTTGMPLVFALSVQESGGSAWVRIEVSSNASTWIDVCQLSTGVSVNMTGGSAEVPPGWYYRATFVGILIFQSELRP